MTLSRLNRDLCCGICVCWVRERGKGVNGLGWLIVLRNGRCVIEKRRTRVCTKCFIVVIWRQSGSRWQERVCVCAGWASGGGTFLTALQNQPQIYTYTCSLCCAHTLPLEVLSDPGVCTGQVGGHVGEND